MRLGSSHLLVLCLATRVCAQSPDSGVEFFEKKIRPVLAEKCYPCHSAKLARPMGGLRLDTRDGGRKGGDSGPAIAPGDPGHSALITAISYQSLNLKMPPTGKLSEEQIADFTEWIRMGAPDPRADEAPAPAKKGIDFATARKFWSFQPVKDTAGASIDSLIGARLKEQNLTPATAADKRTLIRRVTLDLIGLPPTRQEVEDFLADPSPQAFAKVVDRLLASPHYGERWARHWLDLVRYAETNGHEFDNDKMDPWRYRDYVIRAFNDDIPYDQFVSEHIAGDLLAKKRLSRDGAFWESPLGTGFYWFGEVLNSATDSVKSRADEVDNQIDVISKTFLGLTVACARCHDHKFDPIPTADYYSLAGMMHSTALTETVIDVEAEPSKAPEGEFKGWTAAGPAFVDGPLKGSDGLMGSLTSPTFRMPKLFVHVRLAGSAVDSKVKGHSPLRVTVVADGHKAQHALPDGTGKYHWRTLRMTKEIGRLCYIEIVDRSTDGFIAVDKIVFSDSENPPADSGPVEAVRVMADTARPSIFATIATDETPHDVKIHIRGNHQSLGETAPRRFLQVIAGQDQPPIRRGSGRLELAAKIADPENPLTARVMVNRIWKHHFGYGLVRSTDNFGKTGDAPTHPELLDYLAARFVESGWSVKAMHRLILLSNAYQMSSAVNPAAAKVDPENKLLHHFPVQRLEAEAIRDSILAVAGTLDEKMLGPSVPPYISKFQDGRGKPESGPLDGARRRSIYIQVRRNFLTPMFLAFDYPLPISAIGRRSVSTVPSQALILMNDEFMALEAGEWAKRTAAESDPRRRVTAMYETAFARPPEEWELKAALEFVKTGRWADLAHVLFNSAEFIYVR